MIVSIYLSLIIQHSYTMIYASTYLEHCQRNHFLHIMDGSPSCVSSNWNFGIENPFVIITSYL